MAKILVVLYPDPVDGYPPVSVRESIPAISAYPGTDQPVPQPAAIDFTPGELLGSVSGELGLRKLLDEVGDELVVTSDKDGPDSVFEKELPTADVVISQPFWPAYLDAARIAKAKRLKLVITAGIGSDHVDLDAAMRHGITVAEVTYSNSISVAEHAMMLILDLVRDFVPAHEWVTTRRGWNIADAVSRSYDLEGMDVGVMAAGRIGVALLRRLKPFDVNLFYTDKRRLPAELESELGLTYVADVRQLVKDVDVLSIHAPLTHETSHLFDEQLLNTMRRGAYREHRPRRDRRARRHRPGVEDRSARRVRRRCLVPAAPGRRPPVADHAAQCHDPAHVGQLAVRAGPICRRDARDPRRLPGREADPGGVPHRRRREARRHRPSVLHHERSGHPRQHRNVLLTPRPTLGDGLRGRVAP